LSTELARYLLPALGHFFPATVTQPKTPTVGTVLADGLNPEHITTFTQAEAIITDLESGQGFNFKGQLAEFCFQLEEFSLEELGDLSLVLEHKGRLEAATHTTYELEHWVCHFLLRYLTVYVDIICDLGFIVKQPA
jgi:hypothetical protein